MTVRLLALAIILFSGCNRAVEPALHQPQAFWFILSPTASQYQECATVGSRDLVFENVAASYKSLEDVSGTATNTSSAGLALDPIQLGLPALFHYNDRARRWEEVATLRCANAGAGNPRELPPGAALALKGTEAGFSRSPDGLVEMVSGQKLPLRGSYVLALRYASPPWQALMPSKPRCTLAYSRVFRVE